MFSVLPPVAAAPRTCSGPLYFVRSASMTSRHASYAITSIGFSI